MADIAPQFGIIRDALGGSAGAGIDLSGSILTSTDNRSRLVYSAACTGLVPAASCTDVWQIIGSATKTIRLHYISISGTAGTLVTLPIYLCRRISANTGGSAATGLALPLAVKHDTGDAAATATLTAYTAVPTIVDTSPQLVRSGTLTLPVTTAGVTPSRLEWDFTRPGMKAQVLRGVAQTFCINLSTISVSSGLLNIECTWSEDAS